MAGGASRTMGTTARTATGKAPGAEQGENRGHQGAQPGHGVRRVDPDRDVSRSVLAPQAEVEQPAADRTDREHLDHHPAEEWLTRVRLGGCRDEEACAQADDRCLDPWWPLRQ